MISTWPSICWLCFEGYNCKQVDRFILLECLLSVFVGDDRVGLRLGRTRSCVLDDCLGLIKGAQCSVFGGVYRGTKVHSLY
jgi:hypothetical protein